MINTNTNASSLSGYGYLSGVCPSCGHCPHCGRGGYYNAPYYPHIYSGGTSTTTSTTQLKPEEISKLQNYIEAQNKAQNIANNLAIDKAKDLTHML